VGRLLCHCLVVEEGEVRKAIRAGARTIEEVGDRCEAGTGCGSCRAGITVLLADEARRRARRGVEAEAFAALAGQIGLFGERPANGDDPPAERSEPAADDQGQ
jgi:bacterioferritin-associated ferredoxin